MVHALPQGVCPTSYIFTGIEEPWFCCCQTVDNKHTTPLLDCVVMVDGWTVYWISDDNGIGRVEYFLVEDSGEQWSVTLPHALLTCSHYYYNGHQFRE